MERETESIANWMDFIDEDAIQEQEQYEGELELEAYYNDLERERMREQYGCDWLELELGTEPAELQEKAPNTHPSSVSITWNEFVGEKTADATHASSEKEVTNENHQ